MNVQLILARTTSGCTALFVNQVVVAEANTTAGIDRLVVKAARALSLSLGVPLTECTVDVPDEMGGTWVWSDLYPVLPPVAKEIAASELVAYCWSEGGVHPDTEQGPGDAWDDLCFDLSPPVPDTPFIVLVPLGTTSKVQPEGPGVIVSVETLNQVIQQLEDIEGAHSTDRLIAREAAMMLKSEMPAI